MFLIIALVLLLAWVGGFVVFHTAGFLIHLLLVFAVISVVSTSFAAHAHSTRVGEHAERLRSSAAFLPPQAVSFNCCSATS